MLQLASTSRLRLVREVSGLRAITVARQVGLSHPFLSHLETGREIPTLEVAERLAAFFAVPMATLFPEVRLGTKEE